MADNTHETKIVISGDSSSAIGALKGVINSLTGVRSAVSKLLNAFGLWGMALQGVKVLVEGYKKLAEWMGRARRAAAEMRIAAVFKDAADAMDRLISKQEIYNKLLKKELADLGRLKELQQIEQSGKERRDDEQREISRAKELALAQTPEEERALRQRWAVEDETRARGKTYRQLKASAAEEDEKAAIYGSKAGAAEANATAAGAAIEDLRASKIRMSDEQKKEADKQIAALEAKRKASAAEAEQYRIEEQMSEKRAALYRRQIDDVRKGGGVAQAKNDAENAKIAREKEQKDFEEQQEKARESDAAANEFVESYRREQEQQEKERQDKIDSYYGGIAANIDSSRPKDRLTAMGLGSGAAVDRTAQEQAKDVKLLVQLLKEQNNLTREKSQANVAVYAP